jgi:hypothetical protein
MAVAGGVGCSTNDGARGPLKGRGSNGCRCTGAPPLNVLSGTTDQARQWP